MKIFNLYTLCFKTMDFKTITFEDFKYFLSKQSNEELLSLKRTCDEAYYNSPNPLLKDFQYDYLKDLVKDEEVGFLPENNREKLPVYMGSMNKIKAGDNKPLENWVKKNTGHIHETYVIEGKVDGVSCLYVNDGENIKLFTRGNGFIGSNISNYLKFMKGFPNINKKIIIRGELVLYNKDFEKFNDKYSNPRNMVSGLVNSKSFTKGLECINFIAYEIIQEECNEPEKQLQLLEEMGFTIVSNKIVNKNEINSEDLLNVLCKFKENIKYDIDGIIIHSNKKYKRKEGENPKYAFAFKTNTIENIEETEILEIQWNITKWNVLKPTIILKPVKIQNVNITRVSGHNAKYIKDNLLGPGSKVQITRSGDVIPYIVNVLNKSTEYKLPFEEYDCLWNESEVDLVIKKENDEFKIKKIVSFFKDLDIKYLSQKTVEKLYKNGFNDVFKIIKITKEELLEIDTFKEKSSERLVDNIKEGLEDVKIYQLLSAYGIFGFGISLKKIEKLFMTFPNIIEDFDTISNLFEKINDIEGFSDKTTQKIIEKLEDARKIQLKFEKLDLTFEKEVLIKEECNHLFEKIVFSGFRDKDLEKNIKSLGGKVISSLSKNTTVLVVKDKNSKSSKIDKAKKLNVKILDKNEFLEML